MMAARAQEFRERVPGMSKVYDSRLSFSVLFRLSGALFINVNSVDKWQYILSTASTVLCLCSGDQHCCVIVKMRSLRAIFFFDDSGLLGCDAVSLGE